MSLQCPPKSLLSLRTRKRLDFGLRVTGSLGFYKRYETFIFKRRFPVAREEAKSLSSPLLTSVSLQRELTQKFLFPLAVGILKVTLGGRKLLPTYPQGKGRVGFLAVC